MLHYAVATFGKWTHLSVRQTHLQAARVSHPLGEEGGAEEQILGSVVEG